MPSSRTQRAMSAAAKAPPRTPRIRRTVASPLLSRPPAAAQPVATIKKTKGAQTQPRQSRAAVVHKKPAMASVASATAPVMSTVGAGAHTAPPASTSRAELASTPEELIHQPKIWPIMTLLEKCAWNLGFNTGLLVGAGRNASVGEV